MTKSLSFIFSFLFLIGVCGANAAMPLTGFYQTIDDEIKKPKSIVRLYECGENLCGRIVALYDLESGKVSETLNKPERVADKVDGAPKMAGLDIIWNMKWDADDNEYSGGKIMDPKKGSVYSSVIWADKNDADKLNVRGKIGPFGRTQIWNVMNAAELPSDLQKLDTGKWEAKIIK
ncbi:MAG: DUF2147 domain-containing protein [Rickettsiales bacterium]|jgi:uncharacterized protein (DUF2147 family)|nr:DUF2147 domain-containing protein [Rickettsiales bacterium]